jgi:hypothetical protein
MKLSLPEWLPQALLVKILIYAGVGLVIFLWWRADRAKMFEQGFVKGEIVGEVRLEKKMQENWDKLEATLKLRQTRDEENYLEMSRNVQIAVGNTNAAITTLRKLTGITLTIDERTKAYAEARAVPPDQLDRALLLLSRELDAILAKQPDR